MKLMKWILVAAGVLVVFVLLLFLIGLLLPRKHVYARSVRLRQTPDAVFSVLADVENLPKWSRNIVAVEKLPPVKGQEATRQTLKGSRRVCHLVRRLSSLRRHRRHPGACRRWSSSPPRSSRT